ncbi:MAG TPA: MFS transporter [Actinomycetales bacterium]|nr:MFS transporter [Actinomycetales bacterium]
MRAASSGQLGGHRVGDPAFRRISVALFAAGLATFALLYTPQPLLPELATAFDVSAAQSALSVSVCTLGLGAALLVVGPVSELVGRTPLMHASLFASSVVGLACSLAPGWTAFLLLRAVQGVTLAGLPAVAMAYLREEVADDSHARATGLYVGGTALGGMVGRLVSGGLAELGGWRVATAGVGALGLACALVVAWLLPASRRFMPAHPSARSLAATTAGVLRDPALLALYGLAATMMGGFVAVYNATGFRLAAPPYLLGVGLAGLVFCVYPLGSVGSAYAGRLADRHGRRAVVPAACLLTVAGLLLTLSAPLPLVVLGLGILTAGFFAAHGVASGWVAARAQLGAGGTAQAASLYLFAYYLGSSVFGGLAGAAWTAGRWPAVVLLAGGLFAVGLVLALLLRRTRSLLDRPAAGAAVPAS